MIKGVSKKDVQLLPDRFQFFPPPTELSRQELASRFFFLASKSLVSDDTLVRISNYCAERLYSVLESPDHPLSLESIKTKILNFFRATCHSACLILSEFIFAVSLIDKLISQDLSNRAAGKPTIIRESNVGTLLLCGIIISLKFNRDIPFTTSWWSAHIGVPVSIINQSELTFLISIHFDIVLDKITYWNLFSTFARAHCCPPL